MVFCPDGLFDIFRCFCSWCLTSFLVCVCVYLQLREGSLLICISMYLNCWLITCHPLWTLQNSFIFIGFSQSAPCFSKGLCFFCLGGLEKWNSLTWFVPSANRQGAATIGRTTPCWQAIPGSFQLWGPGSWSSRWDQVSHEKRAPGWLGYIGDDISYPVI